MAQTQLFLLLDRPIVPWKAFLMSLASVHQLCQSSLLLHQPKNFQDFSFVCHMQNEYLHLIFLHFASCQPEGHLVSCMDSHCPLLELCFGLSRCRLRVILHSLGRRSIGPLVVAIFIYQEINYANG